MLSPRAIARRSARAATVAEALKRLVGYDNERGKGDHRHIGDRQERYVFKTVELLIADFLANVRGLRGACFPWRATCVDFLQRHSTRKKITGCAARRTHPLD
jgi:hypothetical protein